MPTNLPSLSVTMLGYAYTQMLTYTEFALPVPNAITSKYFSFHMCGTVDKSGGPFPGEIYDQGGSLCDINKTTFVLVPYGTHWFPMVLLGRSDEFYDILFRVWSPWSFPSPNSFQAICQDSKFYSFVIMI